MPAVILYLANMIPAVWVKTNETGYKSTEFKYVKTEYEMTIDTKQLDAVVAQNAVNMHSN